MLSHRRSQSQFVHQRTDNCSVSRNGNECFWPDGGQSQKGRPSSFFIVYERNSNSAKSGRKKKRCGLFQHGCQCLFFFLPFFTHCQFTLVGRHGTDTRDESEIPAWIHVSSCVIWSTSWHLVCKIQRSISSESGVGCQEKIHIDTSWWSRTTNVEDFNDCAAFQDGATDENSHFSSFNQINFSFFFCLAVPNRFAKRH